MPPVREHIKVETRDQRETTRDCRECKSRSPSDQLNRRIVPREKRVSGTRCSLIEQKERKDSSCQRVSGKSKDGGEDDARVR